MVYATIKIIYGAKPSERGEMAEGKCEKVFYNRVNPFLGRHKEEGEAT